MISLPMSADWLPSPRLTRTAPSGASRTPMPCSADRYAETSAAGSPSRGEGDDRDPVRAVGPQPVYGRADLGEAVVELGEEDGLVAADRALGEGVQVAAGGGQGDGADEVRRAGLVPGRDVRPAGVLQRHVPDGAALSRSRRPASTPAPNGAYILCPENAR